MLINFRFKNVNSFYEESNFSLEATTDKELKSINTFTAVYCKMKMNY